MAQINLHKNIGQALIEYGAITENQFETAMMYLQNADNRISKSLVQLGFITEKQLAEILSKKLNYPNLALDGMEINPEVAKLIPYDLACRCVSIPVLLLGNTLTIATDDPLDIATLNEISSHTHMEIRIAVAPFTQIQKFLEKYQDVMIVGNR
jgi:type IV pilus assembly protein PilB